MIENIDKLVISKMKKILSTNPSLAQRFFNKWSITIDNIDTQLSDYGLHGGTWSKKKSLENLNLKGSEKILNIGPEIGTEVFMLAELAANTSDVHILDPDSTSLTLLKDISKLYITESNIQANKILKFFAYGFQMTPEKIFLEQENYKAVHTTLGRGLPTFYNLETSKSLRELDQKYDVIYVHKILTTLKRFTDNSFTSVFSTSVSELKILLQKKGFISWTEPSSLISDDKVMVEGFNVERLVYRIPEINEEYSQYILHNIV